MNAPFNQISIGEALIRSRKEEKAIFAYFYSESTTEQNTGLNRLLSLNTVQDWLESNTVPISINVEEEHIYTISDASELPCCRLMSPHLRKIGEITEIATEQQFLGRADDFVNGVDSLPYAKKRLRKGNSDNPIYWLDLARAYSRWGYALKAEKIFLKLVSKRIERRHCASFIHGPCIGSLFLECFDKSDRLIEKLRTRRDELHKSIYSLKSHNYNLIIEYVRINQILSEKYKTNELYNQLAKKQRGNTIATPMLLEADFDLFYHQELYKELNSHINLLTLAEGAFCTYEEELRWSTDADDSEFIDLGHSNQLNKNLKETICHIYEVLLTNRETSAADRVAERLLLYLSDAESYNLLARFGSRSTKPRPVDLDFARKATKLDSKKLLYKSTLYHLISKRLDDDSIELEERRKLESELATLKEDNPTLVVEPFTPSFEFMFGNKKIMVVEKKIDHTNER